MELFRNGHNLYDKLSEFVTNSSNIFVFVPYIKVNPLKKLLENNSNCQLVMVRWATKDLVLGSSDLEVYQLCKDRGIKLFRNHRLHLKAFIDAYKRCFLGSANISNRAFNDPPSPSYNYELATIVDNLSFNDRLYFSLILNEATLITDSIYEQILTQLPDKRRQFPKEEDFQLEIRSPDKNYLISALPMSNSVKTLTRVYLEKKGIHEEEINCAMHDLALYDIPIGLQESSLIPLLRNSFLNHPFVKAFIEMLKLRGGEIYFGEAKAWVQNNCADVPTPRRWEITENIQILYKWLTELGDDKFVVDRPNHSERLKVLNY